jgi:hypothetical protein
MNELNVEAIMQEIRQQILAQKGEDLPVQGKKLPAEFYEHLYEAGLIYDQLPVKIHVTKVNIPIVGKLIEWLRGKLHQLVVYYVNQVALEQVKVNRHLIEAIGALGRSLEEP